MRESLVSRHSRQGSLPLSGGAELAMALERKRQVRELHVPAIPAAGRGAFARRGMDGPGACRGDRASGVGRTMRLSVALNSAAIGHQLLQLATPRCLLSEGESSTLVNGLPMSSVDASIPHEALRGSGGSVEHDGFDTLYRRLRAICHHRLSNERVDHTLQATALANEVFLKLLARNPDRARNPIGSTRWFIANAVVAIREVLVDHARSRGRGKRGGGWGRVAADLEEHVPAVPPLDPVAAERIRTVDALLSELAVTSSLQAEIVALRFFAGLTFAQIAEQVGRPETTVRREWVLARIWMGQRSGTDAWED